MSKKSKTFIFALVQYGGFGIFIGVVNEVFMSMQWIINHGYLPLHSLISGGCRGFLPGIFVGVFVGIYRLFRK